jgi:hypothetical protein
LRDTFILMCATVMVVDCRAHHRRLGLRPATSQGNRQ